MPSDGNLALNSALDRRASDEEIAALVRQYPHDAVTLRNHIETFCLMSRGRTAGSFSEHAGQVITRTIREMILADCVEALKHRQP